MLEALLGDRARLFVLNPLEVFGVRGSAPSAAARLALAALIGGLCGTAGTFVGVAHRSSFSLFPIP